MWVALLALTVYAVAGAFLLITQGRGHRLLPLFTMTGAALGLVHTWLGGREARGTEDFKAADQGHREQSQKSG